MVSYPSLANGAGLLILYVQTFMGSNPILTVYFFPINFIWRYSITWLLRLAPDQLIRVQILVPPIQKKIINRSELPNERTTNK